MDNRGIVKFYTIETNFVFFKKTLKNTKERNTLISISEKHNVNFVFIINCFRVEKW